MTHLQKAKPLDIKSLSVVGINSSIADIGTKITIPSTYYTYQVNGDNILFNSRLSRQTITFKKNKKRVYFNAENLNDVFVNSILGSDIFKDGSYHINASGNSYEHINGSIIAKNATIEKFAFYNNLMAFMHSVPSLLSFKSPGFNEKGYKIKNGILKFTRGDDMLTVKKLNIIGTSADITGKGFMNLKSKNIDIELQIGVLKNLTSLISSIPLVGYIVLGEDKKMYTSVNIQGTIKEPKIKTNVIKDTILSPFGIIKRVVQAPFKIFDKKKATNK